MRYDTVKELKDADFIRSIGVSQEMFEKMLAVFLKEMHDFGRPPKLARTDQLLMTQMMYWREYRTMFSGSPMVSVKRLYAGRSKKLKMC
jgi:chorismate-pyruvate lyase